MITNKKSTCTNSGEVPNADKTGCEPCTHGQIAIDDQCQDCPAGLIPNFDQTECLQCPPTQIAVYGQCYNCHSDQVPNSDQTGCIPCPPGQIPNDDCFSCMGKGIIFCQYARIKLGLNAISKFCLKNADVCFLTRGNLQTYCFFHLTFNIGTEDIFEMNR